MRALFPSFVAAEAEHGSVVRAWHHRAARPASGPGLMSLRPGLEQLVSALRDSLPMGVLRDHSSVIGIVPSCTRSPGFRIILDGGGLIESRAVLLAVPPRVVGRTTANLDPTLAALAGGIRSESSINV